MQIDRVHFYVEDALASRDWFVRQLNFQAIAAGTFFNTHTEIIKSGPVYFLLSSPLTPASPVRGFLQRHPAGVADIAFSLRDIEAVMAKATAAGAKVLQPIQEKQLPQGSLKWSKIAGWGNLSHTLIDSTGVKDLSAIDGHSLWLNPEEVGATDDRLLSAENELLPPFTGIDHAVLNVETGDLERAVAWYEKTLGFQPQQTFKIQTDRSGLHSQVLLHPDGGAQLPINEPTSANSQIQEFLDINRGAGVQHIALRTDNIVEAVDCLRRRGLAFLSVPPAYYTQLGHQCRSQLTLAEWQEIERSQILVDWQEDNPDAMLLQTFTQPIFGQPTFFFELIERARAARGFGEGNFRALFEAMEREQLIREGNG